MTKRQFVISILLCIMGTYTIHRCNIGWDKNLSYKAYRECVKAGYNPCIQP